MQGQTRRSRIGTCTGCSLRWNDSASIQNQLHWWATTGQSSKSSRTHSWSVSPYRASGTCSSIGMKTAGTLAAGPLKTPQITRRKSILETSGLAECIPVHTLGKSSKGSLVEHLLDTEGVSLYQAYVNYVCALGSAVNSTSPSP